MLRCQHGDKVGWGSGEDKAGAGDVYTGTFMGNVYQPLCSSTTTFANTRLTNATFVIFRTFITRISIFRPLRRSQLVVISAL